MEKNLRSLLRNLAVSTVLITIGLLVDSLSVVLLFALVPVFIVLKSAIENKNSPIHYAFILALSLITAQLISFLIRGYSYDYLLFIYPIGITLTTSLYWLVKKSLNSNLGLITIIIYWLSFEYIALLINPEFGNYFIFGALENIPIINFSGITGFLGYSLWALTSNLILLFVLYDSNGPLSIKFRVLSLIYAAIFILAPIWLSLFWDIDITTISREIMIDNYAGSPVEINNYSQKGEWIGRTCTWVAVLLTIYSLVKRKISK